MPDELVYEMSVWEPGFRKKLAEVESAAEARGREQGRREAAMEPRRWEAPGPDVTALLAEESGYTWYRLPADGSWYHQNDDPEEGFGISFAELLDDQGPLIDATADFLESTGGPE